MKVILNIFCNNRLIISLSDVGHLLLEWHVYTMYPSTIIGITNVYIGFISQKWTISIKVFKSSGRNVQGLK